MTENTHATSTQVQLVSRPDGWPTAEDFRTVTVQLDDLGENQVRVANEFMSVDPYMRGRMSDAKSYIPPFVLGETMDGGAVGRVVASRSADLPVGTLVLHQLGWRDVAQADAGAFRAVADLPGASPSLYLGILGMTGLTAYVGLTEIAHLAPGETVFVSGAAGAVGTAVGQIARLLGAGRVIGSAGSDEKVALLKEKYGFDAALNYKTAPVREQLAELAPGGVDVFFDNVGGDHLEAAIDVMNDHGRLALCGAISQYNTTDTAEGPDNMVKFIKGSLSMRGFTLGNHLDKAGEYNEKMSEWFADGEIQYDETVVDGIENAVDAFLGLMRGANTGKMVVRTS
ncbi:NADP-dependent oxidoreductase [Zhihengliuella halotolerans]|uniref:Enoyl reductase (ER) domain-containing protein n=1 Tax=Zhihengliuella halotolerans TaxID=370736 RepID=A0A4Q8AEL9_9MICC|nr:NADP-dependent oxidoreductase [Zhihengliuella halotolerans]RZU62722.1 hypothetical protein EV380_2324 [Zhihengliuella halotolerans]